ncbi:MAG: hypothetical protein ACUZ8E_17840 [Candidatus Anammoxibacter sp.]
MSEKKNTFKHQVEQARRDIREWPEWLAISSGGTGQTTNNLEEARQMTQTCVDTEKKKICIDCGGFYFPYVKNQKRCGSFKYKTGCSWKQLRFSNNEKAKERYRMREESHAKVKVLKAQLATCKEALESIGIDLELTIGAIKSALKLTEDNPSEKANLLAREQKVMKRLTMIKQALATFKPEIQFCDHCDDPLGKKYITRGDSRFCSDQCEGVFFDEINAEKKL